MSSTLKLLAIPGSLRKDSLNLKLLQIAGAMARTRGAEVQMISPRDYPLPVYDGDIETGPGIPEACKKLGELITASNGLLIASPEYNHSMPGGLKNVVDWLSRLRPVPLSKKSAFFLSASPGLVGGNRSLWALRVPFEALGTFVFPDMFSLASADKQFTSDGALTDAKLHERLDTLVGRYVSYAKALTTMEVPK